MNELDEIVVGKILTGNLSLDVSLEDTKRDINFYDVGSLVIPDQKRPNPKEDFTRLIRVVDLFL